VKIHICGLTVYVTVVKVIYVLRYIVQRVRNRVSLSLSLSLADSGLFVILLRRKSENNIAQYG
jgi:hypothetical protein